MTIISTLQIIVSDHQHQEIDGIIVDPTTADAILTVHKNLRPSNQRKFAGLPIARMAAIAWELLRKVA